MLGFDSKKIRLDFPILNHERVLGKMVYLDSAATSQKPKQVIDAIKYFYENCNSNVHRSIHDLGEDATTLYEQAREKVATFINALPEEIVFTKGTTEGINFVADAWGRKNILRGDEIVISQVEHHANLLPWMRLAKQKKAKLKYIKLNKKTFMLEADLDKLITSKTKLVALTHSSNVLGEVWKKGQLESIIKRAHQVGAKVLIDAAQSVPHKKIDIKKLNPDFIAFSAQKILGPTGIGVLYIKKDLHDDVEPYQVGGSMVYSIFGDKVKWKPAPYKFEAGTPPIAQAIGFAEAIDYLNDNINFSKLQKHEASLCQALIDGLDKIKDVKILGNVERIKKEGHLVCFTVKNIHVHDLSSFMSEKGIAVRSGHHCAQPLANLLGVDASLRVSFYMYNTLQDVEFFLKELKQGIKFLKTICSTNS